MKYLKIITILLFIFISCKTQVNDKTHFVRKTNINNIIAEEEKVFTSKCIILFMPDSIELTIIEKKKSQEELNAIEYDKTIAMGFLEDKETPIFIEDTKFYKFKNISGDTISIDKTSYQNWGIIMFNPKKDPKIIFLNEISEEYDAYFN